MTEKQPNLSEIGRALALARRVIEQRPCARCGKLFNFRTPTRWPRLYCSDYCKNRAAYERNREERMEYQRQRRARLRAQRQQQQQEVPQ